MSKEIGGYFELERFSGCHYHQNAIKLNSGRGCLAYAIKLRSIKKIWLPDYLCDSLVNLCRRENVDISFYTIKDNFLPDYDTLCLRDNEWMLLVDYYGQLRSEDVSFALDFCNGNLIVDETQGFFRKPWIGADTLYTCRKWFGVPDGGYLATKDNLKVTEVISKDISYQRMSHVLGRLELTASEFYAEASKNNDLFSDQPPKYMSALTENILSAINYNEVRKAREENWQYVAELLESTNRLCLHACEAPFMYPYLVADASGVRERLAQQKIYVPTLWPNVLREQKRESVAYDYAANILPLPIDQRYDRSDMEYMVKVVKLCLN